MSMPGGVAPRLVASFLAAGAPPLAVLFSTPEEAGGLDRASALGAVREALEQVPPPLSHTLSLSQSLLLSLSVSVSVSV